MDLVMKRLMGQYPSEFYGLEPPLNSHVEALEGWFNL